MDSTQTASAERSIEASTRAIAPAWHTVVVLVVLLGLSLISFISSNLSPLGRSHGRAAGYVVVIVFEWIMVAFIWYGVSRRGVRVRDLVEGSWARPIAVFRDLGIAIGFLIVSGLILQGVGRLLKAAPNPAIRNLLPHGPTETAVFLLLALTAGYCEELIFRGYLQRQLAALTRGATGGIVLQGIAFGASHGYQGWKHMIVISVFGTLFGLLAHWRRTLRPGMIAHFLQDGVGGIVGAHFMKGIL